MLGKRASQPMAAWTITPAHRRANQSKRFTHGRAFYTERHCKSSVFYKRGFFQMNTETSRRDSSSLAVPFLNPIDFCQRVSEGSQLSNHRRQ